MIARAANALASVGYCGRWRGRSTCRCIVPRGSTTGSRLFEPCERNIADASGSMRAVELQIRTGIGIFDERSGIGAAIGAVRPRTSSLMATARPPVKQMFAAAPTKIE